MAVKRERAIREEGKQERGRQLIMSRRKCFPLPRGSEE